MKVLSGHAVSKSLTQSSMDLIIVPATAVPVNSEISQTTTELTRIPCTGNMNINQRRWRSILRRVQKKNKDSHHVCAHPKSTLYGRALNEICQNDGSPPNQIMNILTLLLRKGLFTEGVFRRAGNARALREIKAQLNDGLEVDLKEQSAILLADLIKDFLRQLPGRLLMEEKCQSWMRAMEKKEDDEKCAEIKLVIDGLPEPNAQLLKHVIVLLYLISENADSNKMTSINLAKCISPNLLQTTDNVEKMEEVTNLTLFLIDHCCEIFGEDSLTLYGDSDEEELSDNQDSFSSHHHDSAYDSNDPDAETYKGSCSDVDSIKSGTEEKPQESLSSEEPWTTKLLTRRRSEPTFNLNQKFQQHLSRSQTQMDFHAKLLVKQISDECIVLRGGDSLGKSGARKTSKGCSYCSSSSLESCFSSASESSIHNSPPLVPLYKKNLQRKHSFPIRHSVPPLNRPETPKRRSQSMRSAHLRSRTIFGHSGSTKRAIERTLRHSQTLPEVLNTPVEPRLLSSEEVFQQVDSRLPCDPPSYQQAVQDSAQISLTVLDAICLSKHIQEGPRSSSQKTMVLSRETFEIHSRNITETCCDCGSCSHFRQRSSSCVSEASLPVWCSDENLRESYV
ncbi:hypothetical protein DNTS_009683 [Danionella cerebrum]|uniref:Rho-GAP domain-containing protein n=1 Tax=Danionella cerebrum TaxID=2873325 RepID=A0A553PUK5_9TELE|nr:hypothetical protein DNTS_009683 [Danionella translucida]